MDGSTETPPFLSEGNSARTSRRSYLRIGAFVVLLIGIAGAGVGIYFAIKPSSSESQVSGNTGTALATVETNRPSSEPIAPPIPSASPGSVDLVPTGPTATATVTPSNQGDAAVTTRPSTPVASIPSGVPPSITPTQVPALNTNTSVSVVTNAPMFTPSLTPSSTSSKIYDLISGIALQGGSELSDSESYQSKAFVWLQTNANIDSYSNSKIIQRYALGCIFYSTNAVLNQHTTSPAVEWTNKTGWMSDIDECLWFGLNCTGNGTVRSIRLSNNSLSGRFPDEVTLLSKSLTEFNVGYDTVYNFGDEMSFLGKLTKLSKFLLSEFFTVALYDLYKIAHLSLLSTTPISASLDLQGSYFEYDGIPTFFGKLVNLVYMDIRFTAIVGPLEDTAADVWPHLNKLTYLDISENGNMGSIPSQLAALPALERLYASQSNIEGDLSFIANMSSIFELWLDDNELLGGTIPTEIAKASTLGSLSLTSCSFHGSLPTELGTMFYMQQLWLFNNTLTGKIPTEMTNLLDLIVFQTEDNMLNGTMPKDICLLDIFLSTDCAKTGSVVCSCCDCCMSPCVSTV